MQIHEFSSKEFEDAVSDFFIPVIVHSGPDFRGRVALHELDKDLTLSLTRWGAEIGGPDRSNGGDCLTAPQRLDAGHAAIDLLAVALRSAVPRYPEATAPKVLLEMMLMHVRQHLADPRYACLAMADIAAALGFVERGTFLRAFRR
ncbi:helix-turn-helix domain-containing protein [Pseudonocardia alaniniphila]|uniref:Helix-turn-helix domain-containing protein n=1 Tax=Pseudonocardia alaniniphila TaxID=75291 RepID=A0ABS9TR24_9PSEU|nr:helix-turn-helix domain-containing protein [Pseudonocardia alaniniphila]MCH6171000.1 helix-turn-helix domain-containing protein [Pseudonocardia alaniniphila]